MEIDVVAVRADGEQTRRLLGVGEARWGTELDLGHLDRLLTAQQLAAARGFDAAQTRLMLFSGAGFAPPLVRRAAADDRVELIDLTRLYSGD